MLCAIALLKDEGLLRVDRGRGTFVATTTIKYPIGKRVRYNESLKAQGIKASYQTLKAIAIPANTAIAKALNLDIGAKVFLVERLGLADDQPISIATSYFPGERFPDLIQHWENYTSVSKLLQAEYNCEHFRHSTRVSARIVREDDARLLQVSLNHPILLADSLNVDSAGELIEYGVTRLRGDRMELVFEN